MFPGFDGVVLGVDAKSVEADGLEHLTAPHALIPPVRVDTDVAEYMADV